MSSAARSASSVASGWLPADFGDVPALAARIAVALGVPHDEALARLVDEHRSLGSNVRRDLARCSVEPHVWSDDLARFYESTDAFFFELCAWNTTAEKRRQRQWIIEHLRRRANRPLTILCFGDGLGFDGVEFARAGHAVTGFEISRRYRPFAERLAHDHGVSITWCESEDDLLARRFDVVVSLDVLEHVPDPPGLVRWMTGLLAPDGELIVHAPFWLVDRGTTTHLSTNRTYSGDLARLYAPVGLVPVDARWLWNPLVLTRREAAPGRPPARVGIGGWLLRMARFMPLPFTTGVRCLLGRDLRHRLRACTATPGSVATGDS